jgi:ATP-dependent RNA helicase DeaD
MEKMKFEEVAGISSEIKKAVEDMGFEEMTPIQQMAIPFVYEGLDIVGQAQTGTG